MGDSLRVTGLLLLIKYLWNLFCNTTKRIQIVGCLFINLHEDETTLNQNFKDVCFSGVRVRVRYVHNIIMHNIIMHIR